MVEIISFNCQGLGSYEKRKDVFGYIRNLGSNIFCLQDTHFTPELELMIRNEWGFDAYFNSYTSNSRGVAILFQNNFDYKVLDIFKDNSGNLLILKIKIDDLIITLANVYGPNTDSPDFYSTLFERIEEFDSEYHITCGDFNLVQNPEFDYHNYLHVNNPRARLRVLDCMHDQGYIDPFRELHGNIKRYTWRKKNPLKQARLDFFLVSENLAPSLDNLDILLGYRSDHSHVKLTLKFNQFKRGKGLWKFNNSLLYDTKYVNKVNEFILKFKKQHCLPIYNIENIDNIPDDEIQFILNDQMFLEMLLLELRGLTISYASFKKKEADREERELISEIDKLSNNLNPNN